MLQLACLQFISFQWWKSSLQFPFYPWSEVCILHLVSSVCILTPVCSPQSAFYILNHMKMSHFWKTLSHICIYNVTKAKRALWLVNLASTICPWVYTADVYANVYKANLLTDIVSKVMADVLLPEMGNCLHSCLKMKLYWVTGVQYGKPFVAKFNPCNICLIL